MVLAVVLFPLKLCDPQNMLKFFYWLQSLYGLGRLNCRLCRSACIRYSVSVGLSSFSSVLSGFGSERFLLNHFPVHHSVIAADVRLSSHFPLFHVVQF